MHNNKILIKQLVVIYVINNSLKNELRFVNIIILMENTEEQLVNHVILMKVKLLK